MMQINEYLNPTNLCYASPSGVKNNNHFFAMVHELQDNGNFCYNIPVITRYTKCW